MVTVLPTTTVNGVIHNDRNYYKGNDNDADDNDDKDEICDMIVLGTANMIMLLVLLLLVAIVIIIFMMIIIIMILIITRQRNEVKHKRTRMYSKNVLSLSCALARITAC